MKGFLPASAARVLLSVILFLTTVLNGYGREVFSNPIGASSLNIDLDENGLVVVGAQAALDHIGESGTYTSLVSSPASFSCADVGEKTVVITATRGDGSTVDFNVGVSVRDVTEPTLVLNAFNLSLDVDGMATLNWWDIVDTTCDVAGGNCTKDNCSINYALSQAEFTCSDIGVKNVTVTATDAGGNTVMESVDVTVVDEIAPVLVLKNGTVGLNNFGTYTLQEWRLIDRICDSEGNNCTKDACGYTVTISQREFTCANLGLNVLTVTATDASGNSTTGSATFNVIDGLPPVVQTKDITLSLGEDGTVSLEPEMIDNGSFDNCSSITLSASKSVFNCDDIGTHSVTLTATQVGGWGSSGTATVTIVDDRSPVVVTKNIAVDLDPVNGFVDVDPRDILVICPDAIIEEPAGPIDGFVPGDGEHESVEFRIIEFEDCTKDNCKITSLLLDQERFTADDIGENTVTIYAYDESNNYTISTAVVTVNDNIVPTAISKDITVDLDSDGNASITASDIDNGSSDNVSVILSIDKEDFSCNDVGENIITLTVQDPSGNTAVTTSTVTVRDKTAPIVIRKVVIVELDETGNKTIVESDLYESIDEACIVSSVVASKLVFSCADIGENTISLTVDDVNGNQSIVDVTATVTDTKEPVLIGKDLEISLDVDGSVEITADQLYESATDNCSLANVVISKSTFRGEDLGVNNVLVTATDSQGNTKDVEVKVTVVDVIPPVVLKRNLLIDLFPDGTVSIDVDRVDAGSSDNVGIVSRTLSQYEFDCSDVGVNEVLLTVSDAAGNETVGTSVITIRDQTVPVLKLKNISVNLGADGTVNIAGSDVDNGSSDACGIDDIILDRTSFSCSDIGNHTINVRVIDVNGLESQGSVLVTVVDDMAPVFVANNITVDLDETRDGQGMVSISPNDLTESIVDNCGSINVTLSKQDFTCADLGENAVTITVTDNNGNESSQVATVTVRDITPPTIEFNSLGWNLQEEELAVPAEDFIVSTCVAGLPVHLQHLAPCTQDNCSINITVSKDGINFVPLDGEILITCEDVGGVTITVRAEDGSGNVTQETRDYPVTSTKKPEIVPKDIDLYLNTNGEASIAPEEIYESVVDICGISSITVSKQNFSCDNIGNNPVTITATDIFGNVETASTIVKVVYNHAPVITPKNITVDLDESRDGQGKVSIVPDDIYTLELAECISVDISVSKEDFTCADLGANIVTITATDGNGNEATAEATVTVRDVTPPFVAFNLLGFNLYQEEWAIPAANFIKTYCLPGRTNSSQPCTNDNCSVDISVSKDGVNFVPLDGEIVLTCSDVGGLFITIRAVDGSGNTTEETQEFELRSTKRPDITPKEFTAYLDGNGSVTINKEDVYESVTDICGISSIEISKLSFNCEDIGTNEVTITATDIFGNVQTASSTVTVADEIGPIIEVKNIEIELDGGGIASISGEELYGSISDNCGNYKNVNVAKTSFDCNDLGVNEVMVTAEDDYGNTGSAKALVTVRDIISPMAVTKDFTVLLNESGSATIEPSDIDDGSNDACGIDIFSLDKTEFSCDDLGENVVTLRVTDGSGNQHEATAIVTVVDEIAPTILVKDISVDLDELGKVLITTNQLYEAVNDNCGVNSIVASKLSFDCNNVGLNEVILTATDASGNEQIATVNVTVRDIIKPTVITKSVALVLNIEGNATLSPDEVDNNSIDACGIQSRSLDKTSFSCSDIGENVVTLTVIDMNGNQSEATATVMVKDESAPLVLTKEANLVLDENGNAILTPADVDNGSTDACGISSRSLDKTSFSCADLGENTVTLTVVDNYGNQNEATAIVTVVDERAPDILPKNITLDLDGNGNAIITEEELYEEVNDNCEVSSIVASKLSFDCTNIGVNEVTITATDASGNEKLITSSVTVRDVTGPIVRTKNIVVVLDDNGSGEISPEEVDNGSTDGCEIESRSLDKTSFTCEDVGEVTVLLTVIDIHGNANAASATITVRDETSPVIITKDITVDLDETGEVTIKDNELYDEIDDNCEVMSIAVSKVSFDCSNVGENEVIITATDASGNQQIAKANVLVRDLLGPAINTKDVTLKLDESGNAFVAALELDNGSTDACGIQSRVLNKENFTCADLGENLVTITVVDIHGNEEQASAIVTVIDDTDPVIVPKDITVDLDVNGNVTISETELYEQVNDNCGVSSIVASRVSFNCSNVGLNEVSITAIDGSGNKSTAISKVTVRDVTGPVVAAKNLIVELDNNGSATVTAEEIDDGSVDACEIESLSLDKTSFNCAHIGENTVTLTVVDIYGNQGQASAIVTVIDESAPEIITQDITVELDNSGRATVDESRFYEQVTDNCEVASITVSKLTFSCENIGENKVLITATDVNGNVREEIVDVMVIENVGPVVITKDFTLSLDDSGKAELTALDIDAESNDACGIKSRKLNKTLFNCQDIGENIVTLTITDLNDNESEGTAIVTVVDEIVPDIIPKDIIVDLDASGHVNLQSNQLYHEVDDNCSLTEIEASKLSFDCTDIGVNEVSIKAVDQSGNEFVAIARVTVGDGIAPLVRSKSATIELDNDGSGVLEVNDIDNGSSDACGIKNISLSKTRFSCSDIGEQIVEIIVEDIHGNIARSTAIVTVVDRSAPELILKTTELRLDQEGKASLEASQLIESQSDNCGINMIKLSKTSFQCQDVGEQEVVVTAVDDSGNVVEKSVLVNVKDEVGPEVRAKSITIELDRLGKAEVLAESVDDGSFDACGIASFTLSKSSFDCNDLGDNTVVVTVKDKNGNEGSSAVLVKVVDRIAPDIVGVDLELFLDESGRLSTEPSMFYRTVTDNCGVEDIVVSKLVFDCSDIGSNTVAVTARDKSGNQRSIEVNVKINDNKGPTIRTKSIVLNLDNLGNAVLDPAELDNGSTDGCAEVTLRVSRTEFSCSDLGEHELVVTAIDNNGNESTSKEVITIRDQRGPAVVTKDITLELDENGRAEIDPSSVYSSITDNCSLESVAVSKLTFDCNDIGVQEVTILAIDKAGNESYGVSKVTVVDSKLPLVVTRNIEIELDENGNAVLEVEEIDNGTSDNCSIARYELSKSRFSCSDMGVNEVTLRAIDTNGNRAESTASVTVVDKTSPIIVTRDYVVDLDIDGRARLNQDELYSSITDNCELKSVVASPLVFTCADIGEQMVTITAIDYSDNISEAEVKVNVRDSDSPVVRTKDISVELDASGKAVIRPLDVDDGSRDNCGITLSLDKYEFNCGDVGVNNVVLSATDQSGNQSTGIAKVTVLGDNEIVRAVNTLSLSPLDAVCDNADIVVTLENTVDGLIYSLVDISGALIGKGIGTNGDLRISLSEDAIDMEWTINVSNENGCAINSDITGRIVNASPLSADFERQGSGDILVDVPLQFYDRSVGRVNSWKWTSDGSTFEVQDPLITFKQQGVRSVKLLVESYKGCEAEKIRNYTVEGEWMAMAPTAFSPNATLPENRIFKVITRGLRKEELIIYDRSGRVVHKGENEWSGTVTIDGVILPGPYLFEFHAETVNGVPIFKRGRFMLF